MNWKNCSKAWLLGAYIGVLGIVGAQRDRAWANDLAFRETVRNTDFVSAGVGGLRDTTSASLSVSGIKGTVEKAYLYWHGPMNSDFPLANASIRMDGQTITGVHIGTSDDNCWGFQNSQAYRADVTAQVIAKRNGTYALSQFVKQGTNINANGASMLVFFDDGDDQNDRDIALFEGNDSNAPNPFDALGWNAFLPGVVYSGGKGFLQLHVSDGQIYSDDSVILNGRILRGRGSIFQGTTVPAANSGPNSFGNLWDIKTWDITTSLTNGTNNLLLTHGYIQQDCISLVVAVFNLPADTGTAPPPPPPTNNPPTLTGESLITISTNAPIVVSAEARDKDGDGLDYTITIGSTTVQTGEIPLSVEGDSFGTLSVTNTFPLGDTTVVFTVSDGRTNTSHTTIVRVVDLLPPVIHATNIVVPTDPGKTTAIVNYTVTATDNFPGNVAVVSVPPSGGEFPIGVTTVTVTAVDASGNRSQTTFTVTVTDALPPVITCPPDLIRFTDPGSKSAVVTYTVNATDNLPGVTVICTPPSGSTFPIGTTLITCVATDAAGNKATCTFNVTVNREPPVNHPPAITGPTELIINSNAPLAIAAIATDSDGNALVYTIRIDNTVVQTGTIPAGTPSTTGTLNVTNTFGLGNHTVVFEVNDGQASATHTTTVRVIDNTPPVIHLPPNIVVPVDPGHNTAVVTYTVTATDNFPGPIQIVVQPPSGGTFPIGTTTVTVTATDSSGNTSTGTFTVTVIDNVPPTIACPPNIVRFTDPGTNVALVTYTVTASDNLPGATLVCVPPSGSLFPIGTTTVTCTVTDAAGLKATCEFTVTINPQPVTPTNRPPVIIGQPEITVNHPNPIVVEALATDDDGNPLTWTIAIDGTVVRSGNVPAGIPQTIGTLSLTNGFTLGTHTVVFTANDGRTNGTFTTTVRVIDNTPPVIQVPANIVVPVDAGKTTAVVTYTVTATDNFPGPIQIVSQPPSGGQFPIGTTTVTVTATDASGNTATATFTITVVDNIPPVVNCPADIIRFTDPGSNTAIVHYTLTATDNLPGVTLTCTPPSGSAFPVGTTLVTCVARDAAGNTATCTFNVTIKDQPPVITVPTNLIVAADLGQCSARVDYSVTVIDNTPGWTLVCTPPSGSIFPSGTTTVICTVTDAAGNRATNRFTVTVEDREKPVLQLPANITVTAATNASSAIVNFTVTATDNCSAVTVVTSPVSGSAFPIGTTIVQATATDAAGNVANGTFTITVLRPNDGGGDNEPPVITEITPSKACLWPPNHKMVTVTFTVKATDNSGKPVTAEIISISSNEPENDLGDGNTERDFVKTGALKAQLRAERSGTGTGRIYTIVIAVKDAAGNVTTGTTTVCVPHDMGQADAMLAAANAKPKAVALPAGVKPVRVVPTPNGKKK